MSNTVVTVAEAAARLAVSRSLIRKLLASGRLTRVRIGRCVRVRAEELDALIAGRDPLQARVRANGRARIEEESTLIDD